ncbi:MAG: mercuric reductase [Planctomycetaceae bacterium]|nr:mercuric reductase [Planctomycetaceae bacterium]
MTDDVLKPYDEHNQSLEANVHPPDWVNPTPEGQYNLVVIGAGTAGLVTAAGAAGLGAKVALIERSLMGGDCLNVGCVPSKGILAAARTARNARMAASFGIDLSNGTSVDFARVMERMRRLRAEISPNDSAARFRDLGVDVYLGEGRFTSGETVQVGDQTLEFRKAVIATGARAKAPPIHGLDTVEYLTNESLFSLTELPSRLGVIGAGPIGCEMAQAFANLGSEVILIETAHGVLPREDSEAAEVVRQSLEQDGVRLLCCGQSLRVRSESGKIQFTVESHGQTYHETVDQLLVAVGRAPNVENLGLEVANVEFDNKMGIKVDDRLRTTNPRIFAAGDVCSRYKFTHAADFMARIVIQNALFLGRSKLSGLTIPWCTYTFPEIARVGMDEQEASEQGIATDTYVQHFAEIDRAILDGETDGFVKVWTKRGTDKIVGATIVASHAGDLISEITLAMTNGVGLREIGSTIHPYPTSAEAIRKLGDQSNRTRLTPLVKTLFEKWLRWTR